MARRCVITGKGVRTGNNVSHAKNRTRRRWLPNLQPVSFFSEILKKSISLRVTTAAVRTVEHNGGIDSYVLGIAPTKLPTELRKLRKEIEASQARAA
ncbi:MAG: 50S ribosomal protein L28 [Gammaproteobacteria bacterium]|nr:50S ribosomal protein L28 [Gammaproteobacteria bacterium]